METKTCKNVHPDARNDMNNGIPKFKCSECGCAINMKGDNLANTLYPSSHIVKYTGHGWGSIGFSYCPNCGAKVISE